MKNPEGVASRPYGAGKTEKYQLNSQYNMAKVTIYTTPSCTYCKIAKAFFNEHNVAYEEKNVAVDHVAAKEAMEKSGQMAVPIIDVDGTIVVGFNKPHLLQLLGIK